MIAKDLLTALNDIDPKLLEDVEPWGAAPKTIRRHPVWAVAAALALCLGIGTAVVLLTGQLSLVSPEGSTMVAEDSCPELWTCQTSSMKRSPLKIGLCKTLRPGTIPK